LKKLFQNFGKRWISYGFEKDNDYVLERKGDVLEIHHQEKKVGDIKPSMPGQHNALNSLAAILAGLQAGVPFATGAEAVGSFGGVDRRFQHKASVRGIDFYDDYGHHPTEVRAVLAGFKERFPQRRLVTVFQPHRYSRTQICWSDFLNCFQQTDVLFLTDIYAAGEKPIDGINGQKLLEEIDHGQKIFVSRQEDPSLNAVKQFLKPGDILLTLGAGDISKLGEQMSESLVKG
jgi:UDP-N-acetylmuramate--alanine ligase